MRADRVLVVGASGFLGANLVMDACRQYEVVAHSRRAPVNGTGIDAVTVDLEEPGSARGLVQDAGPALVVNCAALADVDQCEHHPARARRLNTEMPGELAQACKAHGANLVHISTDAVFGQGVGPFTTSSSPIPINRYGETKLAGEHRVLEALPSAVVVRTNIIGWSPHGRRSLLEFFHSRLSRGEVVRGFTDVAFRPISVTSVWSIAERLVASGFSGIWHATGPELISKYDFAVRVARTFGLSRDLIKPSSVADAWLEAPRAANLDVVPSLTVNGESMSPHTVDDTLASLRSLERMGYRQQLEAFVGQEVDES